MAAINQVITLGIGTPADIPHFLLVGLSPTGPVAIEEADGDVIMIPAIARTFLVPEVLTVVIDEPVRIITMPPRRRP